MKLKNVVVSSLFAGTLIFGSYLPVLAITRATIENTQDQNTINNCKAQLQLTDEQLPKFTEDYNNFAEQSAQIKKKYNNNMLLAKGDINKLIFQTDKSMKIYLTDAQFNAYKKLFNSGQMGKNAIPAVASNAGSGTPPTPVNSNAGNKVAGNGAGTTNTTPSSVSVTNLGINALVDPLKDLLKLTPDQYTKLQADTKAYDSKLSQMGGDATSQNAAIKTLNDQTVQKMKTYLDNDQLTKFVLATTLQQNIMTGKNLSPDQKALINKMRYEYKMNDAQIEMVVLVWAEGKVKVDAIQKSNETPQAKMQAIQSVMKGCDNKLHNILTPEQYTAMHDDVLAQIKK